MEVYDADHKIMMMVLPACIVHAPADVPRLVKCSKYDHRHPETSCPNGNRCEFVHVNTDGGLIATQDIHVNYAWRSLDEVKYERLPAGKLLQVLAPNNRPPVESIPSELLLATAGAWAFWERGSN